MPKLTVKDLRDCKGKRQLSFVQVTSEDQVLAAAEAGMDMIGTGFREATEHFPGLVPDRHFQLGLAYGKHASPEEALRDAFAAMDCGAESVYCAMSPQFIEPMAREGIPVIAHVGLVPPKATWVGGMKAVGKTCNQAIQLWRETRDFENAGAFALEMEVVPHQVAAEITRRTSLLTISLGSGSQCDIQYLFSADLLGENRGHFPRHAKAYRNFAAEYDRLQAQRVAAYQEYIDDVNQGSFPDGSHLVNMDQSEFDNFVTQIDHLAQD